jgi:hypothetical protein
MVAPLDKGRKFLIKPLEMICFFKNVHPIKKKCEKQILFKKIWISHMLKGTF